MLNCYNIYIFKIEKSDALFLQTKITSIKALII